MSGRDPGWDALFDPEGEIEDQLGGTRRPGRLSSASLDGYLQLTGVSGAIQVTLDGVVLQQQVPGDVQYYAALTASIGSSARQIDRMLSFDGYEYAVARMAADTHSTLIFRQGDTFIGLLLSGEIAPTHIVARLSDLHSGKS
jgi:predicted regulator of Ras-like GTPase activity (Roadblock/LC7/MglB family)